LFQNIFSYAFLSLALSLGSNLKIFDAIGDVSTPESPATAAMIANKAGLKERYVREWLGIVTCGGFVETDESGEQFWLKPEYRDVISGPNATFMLKIMNMIGIYANMEKNIENVFKKDGPRGADWNDYKGLQKYFGLIAEGTYGNNYSDKFLAYTGFEEKIKTGTTEAIDIGCGNGYHLETFSKALPQVKFTGIDLSKEAIEEANKRKMEKNLTNVEFIAMDDQKIPSEWTGKFDWIMMFDCAHDQPRPDLSFKEIRRALKDDGIFTMVDIDGTGNIYSDKKQFGKRAMVSYLFSTFNCLPCSCNTPDALCLGSMWGRNRAVELLRSSGFKVKKIIKMDINSQVLYVCTK
uniref:Methyltranfer_dom domain-containing protein n=1 Tax=Enterobius vermicularis TaxID=51028 RepID=A0A0N4UW29_ENTVE